MQILCWRPAGTLNRVAHVVHVAPQNKQHYLPQGRKTFGFVVRKLNFLGAFFGAAGENFQDSMFCFPQIVAFC